MGYLFKSSISVPLHPQLLIEKNDPYNLYTYYRMLILTLSQKKKMRIVFELKFWPD